MKLASLFAIFLLFLVAISTARAASFDCWHATRPDERAICSNRVLNDKDVEMATTYRLLKGLLAMGARGNMVESQAEWLKARRACRDNITCLNRRYDQRLATLNTIYASIDKPL